MCDRHSRVVAGQCEDVHLDVPLVRADVAVTVVFVPLALAQYAHSAEPVAGPTLVIEVETVSRFHQSSARQGSCRCRPRRRARSTSTQ